MARMIRNRTAAQASRDRKKEHVAELEHRVKELEAQLSHQQALACCHQHSTSTSTFTLPPSLDSNPTIDPSIATAGTTTLSPAQVEYLTTVRIHFLEEENAQLKAQLELELKRSAELRSNLSRNFCSATEPDLDQTLLGLILKEDELSCSPSLLDPALTGECQPVTPSPLRPTQNSGPTSTDHRLVAADRSELESRGLESLGVDVDVVLGGLEDLCSSELSVDAEPSLQNGFGTNFEPVFASFFELLEDDEFIKSNGSRSGAGIGEESASESEQMERFDFGIESFVEPHLFFS